MNIDVGKLKNKIIFYVILMIVVFVGGVVYFSAHANRGNQELVADLDSATLPEISFAYRGYSINRLAGYTREMDITAVRDTITPVSNGTMDIRMNPHDTDVKTMDVSIYTLNGKKEVFHETMEHPKKENTLSIDNQKILKSEHVLLITLTMGKGKKAYYYTRVLSDKGTHAIHCLDYAYNFHEGAIEKNEDAGIKAALETEEPVADNFSHITIKSDFEHVTYGDLSPSLEGSESWKIHEMNTVTTSISVEYQLRGAEDEESKTSDLYKAREFFRVRYKSKKETALLNYDRRMSQVYETTKNGISGTGILLGIGDTSLPYITNSEEDVVAYVQAGELWCYNKKKDALSQVFTFASPENKDKRNLTNQYDIKLLSMDKKGNLTFAVVGYMNRGGHEGEVGVGVYQFDIGNNSVEEKVFVSTTKSASYAMLEMEKFIYYSEDNESLFIMVNDTLYEYDTKREKLFTVQEGLKEGSYIMSEDGHLFAYVKSKDNGNDITVKNLKKNKTRTIECEKKETFVLLGFMQDDIVYGVANEDSIAQASTGEKITGMYKVEIENTKGKIVKTYKEDGVYTLSAEFDQNMITLKRATKKDDVFNDIAEEYITNNESSDESSISVASYNTNPKGYQVKIAFADGIEPNDTVMHKPQYLLNAKSLEHAFDTDKNQNKFYVYGYGQMLGIYENATAAITQADAYSGVVVSSKQSYVWQRGNRDLNYRIPEGDENTEAIRSAIAKGSTPVEALKKIYGNDVLNLTGCAVEQLLYIVNQGRPIVAMIDDADCVLIVGYSESTITYMDVKTGKRQTIGMQKFEQKIKKGNQTFIG